MECVNERRTQKHNITCRDAGGDQHQMYAHTITRPPVQGLAVFLVAASLV